MREDVPYIAAINHVVTPLSEPIIKEVMKYLRTGENTITISDLMDHLLKDDGFNENEKTLALIIEQDRQKVREDPSRQFFGIKMRDSKDNFREIPENLRVKTRGPRVQGAIYLLETAIATPLFEMYEDEGKKYMGLNLIVNSSVSGGRF